MGKRKSLAAPMPAEFERILLGQFPSKSNPGKNYEVRLGHDNKLYCTCPAWRFLKGDAAIRTCPHTRNVEVALKRLNPGVAAALEKTRVEIEGAGGIKRAFNLPDEEGD